jgi:hypothetical protein
MSIEVTYSYSAEDNVTTFHIPPGGVMVEYPSNMKVMITGLAEGGCRVEVTPYRSRHPDDCPGCPQCLT